MESDTPGLTPRQQRLLPLLLILPADDACRKAGVARSTYYAWLGEHAFADALEGARNKVFNAGLSEVKAAVERAVKTIVGLMAGAKKEDVRLRAASLILEHSLKLRQLEQIEERLQVLESGLR